MNNIQNDMQDEKKKKDDDEEKKIFLELVGKRVKLKRKEMNLTQEKFAKKADINLRHLQDVESGKINMGIWIFAKIARAFKTSADDLMCED
ncbi:MAG: helix-turn-helix domain-containing protein [Oscillospiraceae bacterium]|nr:helix-turn-helix domain-containing protein [Oscillospiraceae bacterium]